MKEKLGSSQWSCTNELSLRGRRQLMAGGNCGLQCAQEQTLDRGRPEAARGGGHHAGATSSSGLTALGPDFLVWLVQNSSPPPSAGPPPLHRPPVTGQSLCVCTHTYNTHHVYTHTHTLHVHTYTYTHMHIYTRTDSHMHVHTHTYKHMYSCVCIQACAHKCVHTHTLLPTYVYGRGSWVKRQGCVAHTSRRQGY